MNKMFTTLRALFVTTLCFIGTISSAQVTPYVVGGLDVDVFASHPCDGGTNGQLVLTLNSANGGSANYTIIGPTAALVTGGVITAGTPVIFNTDPGTLPSGDYNFIFSDGVDVVNTFVPVGGNPLTLQDLNAIALVDNSTDNSSCLSPNGEINIDFTGGSLDLPGGGFLNFNITADNGSLAFPVSGTYTGASVVISNLVGGNYTVTVSDSLSVCDLAPPVVITIADPVPSTFDILAPFNVDVCEDGDVTIDLNGSENNVNYQILANGAALVPDVVEPGTGAALVFTIPASSLTDGDVITIRGTSGLCTPVIMNNSVTVGIDLIPDNSLNVVPLVATICEGDNGTIQVENSQLNVNYQLRNDADDSNIGGPVVGTGGTINLPAGALTTTTTFNVLALSGVCTPVELTTTATITVDLLPDASLPVSAENSPICENTSTNILVDTSENGYSYQLRDDADDSLIGTPVLGDGGTISLPTGNLTATTTFNVLVTNGVCPSVQLTQLATVNVDPSPDLTLAISASPLTVCIGDFSVISVQNSEVGVTYELRTGVTVIGASQGGTGGQLDFNSGALAANTTFNILATRGTCQVQLNNTVTVTVNPLPVPTLGGSASVCENETGVVYTTEAGQSNYVWNVTGGVISAGGTATDNTATIDWGVAGAGTVSVNYDDANGCSAVAPTVFNVTINALPVPTLGGSASVCENEAGAVYTTEAGQSNYVWNVTGGVISAGGTTTDDTATIDWGAAGAGTVSVNYDDANGCSAAVPTVFNVTINALPVPTLGGSASVCENETGVVYTTEAGQTNYVWNVTGGVISAGGTATDETATIDWGVAGAGTVSVNYDDANGCSAAVAALVNVTINALPVPTLGGSASVCENETGVVYTTEAGQTNYVWNVTGGVISAGGTATDNTATVDWGVAGAGTVSVNYEDANGCGAAVPTVFNVTINALPLPTLGGDASVCENETGVVYTTEAGQSNYVWNVTGGVISAGGTATDDTATIDWGAAGAGTVSVNYDDANGCTAAAPTVVNVTINALPATPTLTGALTACENETGVVYTTDAGQSNYVWNVTGGVISAGGTATDETATIDWGVAGAGTVSVNYDDANGCSAAVAALVNVTINALPVPTLGGSASACENETGVVYTTEAGQTNYVWNVTGGVISAGGTATDNTATVDWGVAGAGTVSVNYEDANGCGAAAPTVFNVTINALPAPTLGGSVSVCENEAGAVYTTEAGQSNYVWNVTGGVISAGGTATDNTATIDWGAAGAGTVSVNYDDANGCTAAAATVVNVTINALPATPTLTGALTACENETGVVYTTDAGQSNYVWNVTGGVISAGGTATDETATIDWGVAGAGTVSVNYDDANGCSAAVAALVNVTINALPVPTLGGSASVCENETGVVYTTEAGQTNYVWNVTGGVISAGGTATDNTATVDWGVAGAGTVSVNYEDANGCGAAVPTVFNVTINALPLPTLGGDASVCENETGVVYTTEAGQSNYVWNVTGGVISAGGTATDDTATIDWGAAGAGTVSVNYDDANGCTAAAPTVVNVTINALPATPTLTGALTACENETGVVYTTDAGQSNYVWNVTGGVISAGGTATDETATIDWGVAGAGTVSVNYDDANGCSAAVAALVNVTINTSPTPTFVSGATTVCFGDTETYITEGGNSNYQWTFAGATLVAGGTATDQSITLTWDGVGPYSVEVNYENANGCSAAIPTVLNVTVDNPTITVPVVATDVCETGGTIDLTTLVSGTPAGGTFTFAGTGVTGNTFDPAGLAGVITITVDYTVGGCVAPQETFDINVITTATINVPAAPVAVCESAGVIDLTTIITASPIGGTFTFAGTGVTGNNFDPAGLSGLITITVDYSAGGCVAPQATFDVDVTADPVLTVPGVTTDVCESSGILDLTTLVTTVPGGGTLVFAGTGVTGTDFDPAGQNGIITITADYSLGGCDAPQQMFDLNVISAPVVTVPLAAVDVCETGGTIDLTTLVSALPAGGTFTFAGTGVTGNIFDPVGQTGLITITVDYDFSGCTATQETFEVNVSNSSTITVPVVATDVCETGGTIDLTTLVSGTPAGGTFTFAGTGVTGNTFDPAGLAGVITITVDYTVGGCVAPQETFDINVITTATINIPAAPVAVCESAGVIDLTTIITASPIGGTFTFAGTGVTGNNFDPAGLSGLITITVDYSAGGCVAPQETFDVDVTADPVLTVPGVTTDVCESSGILDLTTLVTTVPGGGTLVFAGTGVTGTDFDPAGQNGIITITADYSLGGCDAPQQMFDLNVISAPVVTVPLAAVDVCETGGTIDLTTLVSALPAGGTFTFAGTGVTGNIFDPVGQTGLITITVDYDFSGCTATQETFEVNVSNSSTITVPVVATDVCETGGTIDLTTLVSGTPAGGTFTFAGTGVTGNTFDPAGLAGVITITVDYTVGGCVAPQETFDINVLDATNPLCGGGGECATVVITPTPSPATCTNSDGSIFFDINPAVPIINNTGVTINITGPVSRTNFNDPNFSSLPIGTYDFTIEYGDPGCIKTGSVTIDQSGTIGTPIATNIIEPACFGEATGSVTIDVAGETGNVLQWSLDGLVFNDFVAGSQITGIPAGPAPTFEQVISIRRDAADPCNAAVIIVINSANSEITTTFAQIADASCDGNDGSVSFTNIQGGDTSAPYTFTLDGNPFNLAGDGVITGLSGGAHEFVILDASGCMDINNFNVVQPGLVTLDFLTPVDPSCTNPTGADGRIEGQISASFLPGTFEINVTDGVDYDTTFNALPNGFFATRDELPQGSYEVTITSAGVGACPNVFNVLINGGPSAISFESARLACINIANPSSRSIILEGLRVNFSEAFEVEVINEQTGDNRILIQEQVSQTIEQGIFGGSILNEPGIYTIVLRQNQSVCGTDLEFLLTNFIVSPQFVGVNVDTLSSSLPDRPTGSFVINMFEGGLEPFRTSLVLIDPFNQSQSFSSLNDIVGLNNNSQFEIIYDGLPAGAYDITIVDSLGCSPFNFNIGIPVNTDIFIPNVFTPNGDGINETFEIRNITTSGSGSTLVVTNRWGKVVFDSDDYYFNSEGDNNFWDGGDEPDGVYFYTIDIEGETYKGWVEIIRGQP